MTNNSNITNYNYPIIEDNLITALQNTYPNILPENHVSDFDLGVLIGQQKVITKLISEKAYNETKHDDGDDDFIDCEDD